jgi:GNAT superfamily N-acetyltransferase
MYVVMERRGAGFSRRMLGALEDEARSLGYRRVRLENRSPPARGAQPLPFLGFEEIPRYGPYADDELSVCFEKPL